MPDITSCCIYRPPADSVLSTSHGWLPTANLPAKIAADATAGGRGQLPAGLVAIKILRQEDPYDSLPYPEFFASKIDLKVPLEGSSLRTPCNSKIDLRISTQRVNTVPKTHLGPTLEGTSSSQQWELDRIELAWS